MNSDHEDEIVHRTLDTGRDNPGLGVAEIVADLEGTEVYELTTVWDCIDGALGEIFSNPPSPEAQLEVKYSYEGYRITVEQNGNVKLVKTA